MQNIANSTDFYKTGHYAQYPEKTECVLSNMTARSSKNAKMGKLFDGKTVFFGLQGYLIEFLCRTWNKEFFSVPKEKAIKSYKRRMDTALGPDAVSTKHLEALHNLGYLPIKIMALPEGSRVPIKVPYFTIENTLPEFYWLVNYLETPTSTETWKPITTATTAYEYRRILKHFSDLTGSNKDFMNWQIHDFSMRGMSGLHDAASSGAAHLAVGNFGTDTITAIDRLEDFYGADAGREMVGGSVPATEHSVMCMGGLETEINTFRRLINDVYPTGVVSIVSDTWDFWKVITVMAVELKEEILARKENALGLAKVVFRPDSGDPADIICGTDRVTNLHGTPQQMGAIECLWNTFGGTINDKGFKTLNQRVGLIYGDSITLDRAYDILERLAAKGFAADNIVFGVGSYTYQYVTRDTFGMAIKATFGIVDGEERELFKDPKTDSGTKKSAKGRIRVAEENGEFVLYDQQTAEDMRTKPNAMRMVYKDGYMFNVQTLAEIRAKLA
jgi:nicotinamide phosphoribosyltransferase